MNLKKLSLNELHMLWDKAHRRKYQHGIGSEHSLRVGKIQSRIVNMIHVKNYEEDRKRA